MKNQEIDGNDYDKHQYRSEKLAESDPQEKGSANLPQADN